MKMTERQRDIPIVSNPILCNPILSKIHNSVTTGLKL